MQGLHAHAGRRVLNKKGAVRAAGRLPAAPADFTERAHGLFAMSGTTPDVLSAVLDAADGPAAEVCGRITS